MINVLMIDTKCAITDGLCAVISAEPDIQLVGHAECGDEGLNLAHELNPKVTVVDPEVLSGFTVHFIGTLKRRCPQTHTLVFANRRESEHAPYAISAGAAGFLSKRRSTSEFMRALRTVARGKTYMPDEVANQIAVRALRNDAPGVLHNQLSPREYDIFQGLTKGRSVSELAAALSISPKTVSTHKARIMDKLKVNSLPELVLYAIEHDLI